MAPMRVGVVGAGTIGADIAEARERFRTAVARHHERSVKRGRMTPEERDTAVARARTTDAYEHSTELLTDIGPRFALPPNLMRALPAATEVAAPLGQK